MKAETYINDVGTESGGLSNSLVSYYQQNLARTADMCRPFSRY